VSQEHLSSTAAPERRAYAYPAVATDVVLFTIQGARLAALLVRRAREPFRNRWALPGGFVDLDEDLEAAAMRELAEETGITGVFLEQLYTFGRPDRDPRGRVISVAYYALVPADGATLRAGSDAREATWFTLDALPPLAFDHEEMVALAHRRLASKLGYSTIALQFMPKQFTLSQLQSVYEIILGAPLDKRNFRKRVLALGCLQDTRELHRDGSHRPARLYRMAAPGTVEFFR
jgi:8-oxo-dGTP diphosphatase